MEHAELVARYAEVFRTLGKEQVGKLATTLQADDRITVRDPLFIGAMSAFGSALAAKRAEEPMEGGFTERELRDARQEDMNPHRRETATPFGYQSAIIVDCSCGAEYVVPDGGDEFETMEIAQLKHAQGRTFTTGENGETYWLRTGESGGWSQVGLTEWCLAEKSSGFRPKPGCGPAATGGFHSGSTRGTVVYPEVVLRLWKEQNGG